MFLLYFYYGSKRSLFTACLKDLIEYGKGKSETGSSVNVTG